MEIFLGAFTTQWEQRRAAILHDLSLGDRSKGEEDERRRRGGAIASAFRSSGRSRTVSGGRSSERNSTERSGQRAADRPMRARFAGLSSGSQPAVVKLASFGGGARLGAMVNYVSRNGAVAVENERGEELLGRDQLSHLGGEWEHLMSNRAESRDIGTFKISVNTDEVHEDVRMVAQAIVKQALEDRAFAIAVTSRSDPPGLEIEGIVVLRSGQGERLTADEKAREIVQRRLDGVAAKFAFIGHGNGTDWGTARLRALVEKHEGSVFGDKGHPIADARAAGDLVQLEWREQLHSRKTRDVMHIVLSARAGTDVEAFNAAAQDFLGRQFAGHRYVFSLHDPANDPKAEEAGGKRPHVHVHAIVAMRSDAGDRIETTIGTFREWRFALARSARTHGIDMEMTDRRDRASPASYSRNQVRSVNMIGKTEHEGTSMSAQRRYDAKRRDDVQPPTSARGQAYGQKAKREWESQLDRRLSPERSSFSSAQVRRLFERNQADRLATIPDAQEKQNSQFRTHMVTLEKMISESDHMQHMTRPEFEAYEKRVEMALYQAERALPENERESFAEIAEAARDHVNVRRELVDVIEQMSVIEREDRSTLRRDPRDENDLRARDDGGTERSDWLDASTDLRSRDPSRALTASDDRRDAGELRGGHDNKSDRKVDQLAAEQRGTQDGNASSVERGREADLRLALQAIERDRARLVKTETGDIARAIVDKERGSPRNEQHSEPKAETREGRGTDEPRNEFPRNAGDTTRGDPAAQHIPRLEELQRETQERHQREHDERER